MNYFDKNIYKLIGSKLRQLRQDKKLSLEQVSKKINKSIKTLSRYEKGEHRLTNEMINELCKIYDYDFNNFMNEIQKESKNTNPLSFTITNNQEQFSYDTILGNELRKKRESLNYSLDYICSKLSTPLTKQSLSRLERGLSPIKDEILKNWSSILNLDHKLLSIKVNERLLAYQYCNYYGIEENSFSYELIENILLLNDEERKTVNLLVKGILSQKNSKEE